MFEQSIIPLKRTNKPWTIVLAIALEVGVVALAIIIPLLFVQTLQLHDVATMLVAPPPPPPPPPPPAATPAAPKVVKVIPRQFDAGKLTAPKTIPKQIAMIKEPDIVPPSGAVTGGVVGGVPGGQVGGVVGGVIGAVPQVAPPPPPPPPQKPATPQRIRVGGSVQTAKLVQKVTPEYPVLAKQARIQGSVQLTAVISKNGSIENLSVVSGHPLLVPAAIQAVRQWRYKPTYLNGEPVEVVTEIDVNFTLAQ